MLFFKNKNNEILKKERKPGQLNQTYFNLSNFFALVAGACTDTGSLPCCTRRIPSPGQKAA